MSNPDDSRTSEIQERTYSIRQFSEDAPRNVEDHVVVEEPVEIRVVFGPSEKRTMRSVSITMRTPGHDRELAAGFLMAESILTSCQQIQGIRCGGVDAQGNPTGNIIRVDLNPEVPLDLGRLQRHFFTTSSCGVCGKASLEALEMQGLKPLADGDFRISAAAVKQLSCALRLHQDTFQRTGGLHAAGLLDATGLVIDAREDVGRHNAVDKLIGHWFLQGRVPLSEYGMIVSGRVSFEIMQKALAAGLPMIVAVGAPSSLAIDMARQYNLTLVGFASPQRFNVYAGEQRVT